MDEERMTNIEIRMAFLEKTLDDLDQVVRELGNELAMLRRTVEEGRTSGPGQEPSRTLEDDKPPHY